MYNTYTTRLSTTITFCMPKYGGALYTFWRLNAVRRGSLLRHGAWAVPSRFVVRSQRMRVIAVRLFGFRRRRLTVFGEWRFPPIVRLFQSGGRRVSMRITANRREIKLTAQKHRHSGLVPPTGILCWLAAN